MDTDKNPGRTRFADYFVICGLDLSSGLEPDTFAGDNLQSTPLERPYKSKVLGHYPENVSWNPFDKNAVCMLCLPNGLQFRTQKNNLEPKFHSFVITKEDGKRTYGASYVFYEETKNRKICSAMQTLQAMHLTELSSGRSKRTPDQNIRSLPRQFNSRSLPRHFKLSAHTAAAQSYYDLSKDTLYVTKCIALISQHQFVHAQQSFLASLHRCWKEQGTPSLEASVYNLLYEVTVPPPGRSLSFCCYPEERVIIQSPALMEDLPAFDFPLRELFTLLGVDCVVQLFTCLLLENQILLCSGEYQRLMLVAESLTALLLPFSWPHVYVPILPASCHHFLDAPVPFVMGLHTRESRVNIPSEANLCYMDLDTRLLQTPEELPTFPHKAEFISEICDVLRRFKVSGDHLDVNWNNNTSDVMSSSCISVRNRKHSWADELEDNPSLTQGSETLQRIVSMTRRTGLSLDGLDDIEGEWDSLVDDGFSEDTYLTTEVQYARDLRINNAIREIFLNRFVQIFSTYEHFIIQPNQDKDEWLSNRESMQNFDKATFLSDQPQRHLPFLSRFIETQMFATLIDNKILSNWNKMDQRLRVFERRIKMLRKRYGEALVRTPCYEPCVTISDTQILLDRRMSDLDAEIPPPREMCPNRTSRSTVGGFPILDPLLLSQEPHKSKKRNILRSRSGSLDDLDSNQQTTQRRSEAKPLGICGERLAAIPPKCDPSPALIAQTNWNFVEKLLKDCKHKIKRMLVEKLGSEALEMGHCAQTSIVEENTLIASLCDLLERVWSHGLQKKQGKSALWAHLSNYLEFEECNDTSKPIDPNFLTPALAWHVLKKRMDYLSSDTPDLSPISEIKQRSRSETRTSNTRRLSEDNHQQPSLRPLPNTLVYDLRSVQAMTDIKTNIGYARAFIRLSLEKKLLSRHLRTLLSETTLLRTQYKRYAFLRCEEEKEQFLYHLLTLNAVDYNCFTNTYLNTRIPYRVAVYPSRKSSFCSTTANCWVAISGTNGETQRIPIPKGVLEFVFHHKNVGTLTTLRIGHDNAGLSPKWLVDQVIVRNEVTGHCYIFPCGRWLGKGIDDDSTERLLVGEKEKYSDGDKVNGSRLRSPSVPPAKRQLSLSQIQHMLGDCVNSLGKYFSRLQSKDCPNNSLTVLLCGESGLVASLEQVFSYGFKSNRLFGRNLYIWDYIVKVKEDLEGLSGQCDAVRYFFNLVTAISHSAHSLGKDGKFQIFVCLSFRDHLLHHFVVDVLAGSRATLEMYEESSFFREPNLLNYLVHMLKSLAIFDITLENSLTHGVTY
ncbi:DENN domain-containing protein 5B isoform X2 [Cimex lectularius]|uniref:DENN domain-containing protein 5B n=1 Tax=Cimex lectularius TaxID=79782 RepID=A0A8I6RAJ5_CIMLE|nr:DENN domain-containing protein 5B isoform X2 [Cimex lectularius]